MWDFSSLDVDTKVTEGQGSRREGVERREKGNALISALHACY